MSPQREGNKPRRKINGDVVLKHLNTDQLVIWGGRGNVLYCTPPPPSPQAISMVGSCSMFNNNNYFIIILLDY
jgi:hypothetical protein